VTTLSGSGTAVTMVTRPDDSTVTTTQVAGRTLSVGEKDASAVQIRGTTMGYDDHGRLETSTDARNGTTTYTYFDDDQIESVTTPAPSATEDAQVTSYEYDSAGRRWKTTLPDETVTEQLYWPTGELKQQSGSQTYTVNYHYDPQGRMKTLTTTGQAGTEVTTWLYHPQRGWLVEKRYPDTKGPSYTHTAAGRMKTRTWERGTTTTYGYTDAGDLETVSYSDATPDVTYGYDRAGRRSSVGDGSGTRSLAYTTSGQLDLETYTGGLLGGLAVDHGFDSLLRRSTLTVKSGTSTVQSVGYGYDDASRLETVTSGDSLATYGYLTNSPLVETVSFSHNGNTVMTSGKTFDFANRLTEATTVSGTATVNRHEAKYTPLNQRDRIDREDGGYWEYDYNAKGEVERGQRFVAGGTPVTGQNFGYAFDGIGNRLTTTIDTVTSGTYASNTLNQYTSIVTSGTASPAYDFDGNLTDDGSKVFEWDGENRLKTVKRKSDNAVIATYTYDDQSRRVRAITTGVAAQGATDRTFLFDGWNAVAQFTYSGSSHALHQTYVWGLDLSGSEQGAGGVGGLLIERDAGTNAAYWPSYDTNGNVMRLVKASDGSVAASYEYDPFGNLLSMSGPYAASNPWRFSTKYAHAETGWYYYGYRYYNPLLGRWVNRDPIGEIGGLNLYKFVRNIPINKIDYFGLYTETNCKNVNIVQGIAAYDVIGGSVDTTGTLKVCDCCDEHGNVVDQSRTWSIDLTIAAGLGIGATGDVAAMQKTGAVFRWFQLEGSRKLTGKKLCGSAKLTEITVVLQDSALNLGWDISGGKGWIGGGFDVNLRIMFRLGVDYSYADSFKVRAFLEYGVEVSGGFTFGLGPISTTFELPEAQSPNRVETPWMSL
jgi:RHS repeat-associated protein